MGRRSERIVLGVSGGSDSVALAALFRENAARLGVVPVWAHLNHLLRGAASDADERFVRALARKWRARLIVRRVDVSALARRGRLSLEAAGRVARYRFFEQVARKAGARWIATAHTADDQAATVLMRLARGTGMAGLRGIHERRPVREGSAIQVIRPLLFARRAELIRYLGARGIPFCSDASNDDPRFERNRVRLRILAPWEKREPRIAEKLCRLSASASRLSGRLEHRLKEVLPAIFSRDDGLALSRAVLGLPSGLRRQVLRAGLSAHLSRGLSRLHVDRLERFLRWGKTGNELSFPGGRWRMEYGRAVWFDDTRAVATTSPIQINGPGRYRWGGWILNVIPSRARDLKLALSDPSARAAAGGLALGMTAVLNRGKVRFPLEVRSRRPGDRIRLASGTKKLSDLFIDRKVPRSLRDTYPVVCARGRPVWIPGLAVASNTACADGYTARPTKASGTSSIRVTAGSAPACRSLGANRLR